MITPQELVEKVRLYIPDADEKRLFSAYFFTKKAHELQIRSSGDPYFSHPLEVASILTDWKLDEATVIAGLFHDILEDTSISPAEMSEKFGSEITSLVEGVTKISKIKFQCSASKQAENFRKFVIAMSHDIRVLLIKLADRLHNMRTLHYLKDPEKRERIARETLEIFVPLSARIGMHKLKDEIETLAFSHLFPEMYRLIQKRLMFLNSQICIPEIEKDLTSLLSDFNVQVYGRRKTPYSIWQKMRQKNISLDQLSDIMAFRIITHTVDECYQVLGRIHQKYHAIHTRFKDYISVSKENKYQSLHTCIFGPLKQRIEIQIRTQKMNSIAELGLAAHWSYKKQNPHTQDIVKYAWIRSLIDILENASHPRDFLEHTKIEIFSDQVFCFTPKGEIVTLAKGATVIDFAYVIHEDIGHKTKACRINGRYAPLKTILENGNQVEIITGEMQDPSAQWINIVTTGKAKLHLKRFFRAKKTKELIEIGKSITEKECFNSSILFEEEEFASILSFFNQNSLDDLWKHIAEGHINARNVILSRYPDASFKEKKTISILGVKPQYIVHYALCCHPLPGDRITGVFLSKKDLKIHTADCNALRQVVDKSKIIDVRWGETEELFVCRFAIVFSNIQGALALITSVISKQEADILNFKIINRTLELWKILADLKIRSLEHFHEIQTAIQSLDIVQDVTRGNDAKFL